MDLPATRPSYFSLYRSFLPVMLFHHCLTCSAVFLLWRNHMSSTPVLLDNIQKSLPLSASPERTKDRILPSMLACMLGLLLLYAAGFAQIPQIHNAAHDTRHSAGFPCH
jgi:cobalt transporter subunit CbtB